MTGNVTFFRHVYTKWTFRRVITCQILLKHVCEFLPSNLQKEMASFIVEMRRRLET